MDGLTPGFLWVFMPEPAFFLPPFTHCTIKFFLPWTLHMHQYLLLYQQYWLPVTDRITQKRHTKCFRIIFRTGNEVRTERRDSIRVKGKMGWILRWKSSKQKGGGSSSHGKREKITRQVQPSPHCMGKLQHFSRGLSNGNYLTPYWIFTNQGIMGGSEWAV